MLGDDDIGGHGGCCAMRRKMAKMMMA